MESIKGIISQKQTLKKLAIKIIKNTIIYNTFRRKVPL